MKKIFTFSFALMASASMFAQTTLWDGENQEIGSQGGLWADGSPTVVANPEKDGINTSDKCLKFTMTSNSKVVKIPFREWIKPSLDGSKRISLMIKKSQNENLQIELSDPTNGSDNYWKHAVAWYGGEGKWQKVVLDFSTNGDFDCPGVMTITAQTGDVTADQDVYIDNVMIEPATKVNGQLLSSIKDDSLNGKVTLTGAWMKGECQNADGDWTKVEYNDFGTLAAKLGDNVTYIDMRGTTTKEADIEGMRNSKASILVFTNENYNKDNVVRYTSDYPNGECNKLVLDKSREFAAPAAFHAEEISITRPVVAGNNSMCLPFEVSKDNLNAKGLYTYKESIEEANQTKINFETKETVAAYDPFIADMENESSDALTFRDKTITATPASLGDTFVGTMAPMTGEGKYGLGDDNTFHKGGAQAKINAFHAYLDLSEASEAKPFVLAINGETTGISSIINNGKSEAVKVYNLQGCQVANATSAKDLNLPAGIYIINNKKVVVK